MTEPTLQLLLGTAATIGLVHTLVGVDHSIPFVVMGRARGWTLRRTLAITLVCGLAHVASSVVLGLVGIGAGMALDQLAWIQEVRGSLAAWGLIAFGLVYAAWAVVRGRRGRTHAHGEGRSLTLLSLFLLFLLGPCEALIPLLMAPAWLHHWAWVPLVVGVFGSVTVVTMLAAVTAGFYGLSLASSARLERHAHLLAGSTLAASGAAILALGI